jgi:hypothetical protein
MKRVINLDKRLNEPRFMNNRLESDEAVKQAILQLPLSGKGSGKY